MKNKVVQFPTHRVRQPETVELHIDDEQPEQLVVNYNDLVKESLDIFMIFFGRELTDEEKDIYTKAFASGFFAALETIEQLRGV